MLTRRVNEDAYISVPPSHLPTLVVVKVLMARGGQARLGFNAAKSVKITRPESGGPKFGLKEEEINV